MPIHYLKATCIENGEFRLTPWRKNAFNSKTKALTLATRIRVKIFFSIKEQKPTLASSKAIEALPIKPPYPYQIGLNKPPYLWRINEQPIDFELQELFHLRLATHAPSRTLNPDQINHIQRGSNWRRKLPLDSNSVMQYPCEGLDFGMGDTGIEPVTISL